MSQHQQYDSGWVGWKSSVFLAACIYLIFKYQPISVQVNGGLVATGTANTEVSAENKPLDESKTEKKKKDTKIVKLNISDAEKKAILEGVKWTTNTSFHSVEILQLKKGGSFKQAFTNFPATTRPIGKNTDTGTQMIEFCISHSLELILLHFMPYPD